MCMSVEPLLLIFFRLFILLSPLLLHLLHHLWVPNLNTGTASAALQSQLVVHEPSCALQSLPRFHLRFLSLLLSPPPDDADDHLVYLVLSGAAAAAAAAEATVRAAAAAAAAASGGSDRRLLLPS